MRCMVDMKRVGLDALKGAVNANLPEIAGCVGAYYTFKDMPYAMDLALYQITESALSHTIVGLVVPIVLNNGLLKQGNGGNNGNGGRKRRNRKR